MERWNIVEFKKIFAFHRCSTLFHLVPPLKKGGTEWNANIHGISMLYPLFHLFHRSEHIYALKGKKPCSRVVERSHPTFTLEHGC